MRPDQMTQVQQIIALAHAGWTFGRIAEALRIDVMQIVGITRNGI